jgi:hypothetical protein
MVKLSANLSAKKNCCTMMVLRLYVALIGSYVARRRPRVYNHCHTYGIDVFVDNKVKIVC